jgi:hypothetical protein
VNSSPFNIAVTPAYNLLKVCELVKYSSKSATVKDSRNEEKATSEPALFSRPSSLAAIQFDLHMASSSVPVL